MAFPVERQQITLAVFTDDITNQQLQLNYSTNKGRDVLLNCCVLPVTDADTVILLNADVILVNCAGNDIAYQLAVKLYQRLRLFVKHTPIIIVKQVEGRRQSVYYHQLSLTDSDTEYQENVLHCEVKRCETDRPLLEAVRLLSGDKSLHFITAR